MTGKESSAKIILDFYMKKLSESDAVEARFSEQYANLHMLKHRVQSVLDTLESYKLEVE